MKIHDHIVVGSGCTGAMAAQTLAEAGVRVTMLDAGLAENKYAKLIPSVNFSKARESDQEQYRYLLGDEFETLNENEIATGAQLTPPRMYLAKQILDTIKSDTFFPMESYAYGGLGSGWGLGCCMFSEAELKKCGLDVSKMNEAYKIISERIGVSGTNDDAAKYTCGTLENIMPSIETDNNGISLVANYAKKRNVLNSRGFYFGRPSLALLTKDKGERKKYNYNDLDFYSDEGKSAYRPWITVDELKKKNNFNYIGNCMVLSFEETPEGVKVNVYDIQKKENVSYWCKKLILAPGVLQTARIVMRSLDGKRLSLLCNPYCYIPSIQWKMLGKQLGEKKIGFAQHSLFHDENGSSSLTTGSDVAMASIYSYHSLMMFRIIKQVPLNFKDARILMQYLMPAFTIFGIHHPESPGDGKYLGLNKSSNSVTGDELKAEYELNGSERERVRWREKKYMKAIKKLGCFPIKKIDPGMGSSIHYSGTLPFSEDGKKFSLSPGGKLNGTNNIFIADGSGFKYLPAKGLTFSLMANAHNVAEEVLKK